ncbi:DUSTY kinase, partial [Eudromia elegans]|nr:DUSTY kinase [Eudromia elegans]
EVDVVVAPCRGFQSAEATLGEYVNHVLPVLVFAISEAELSPSDENELRDIKDKFSLPIFFFKVPELGTELISHKKTDNEKSSLYCQLMDLEYLSSHHCSCGAPGADAGAQSMLVEQSEKLRLLSTFSRQVLQKHLVEAATSLNEVHCRCLNIFINQAFDMQRDLQITPKRLEYTRKKENELYESLMNIANRKQEEMKDMIVETLNNMKEELLEDAATMEFKDIIIPENGEPVSSKDIKCCIKQIQELIISRLNQAVANKLISSVDYLRESFVGTLERCLKSLEESWDVSVHTARSLEKSKDASVHITSNYLKQVWWLKQLPGLIFNWCSPDATRIIQRITWVSPPAITSDWKRKVAQDAIESLSASKLAKSICSQFRTRLNSSHEAFAASLRQAST